MINLRQEIRRIIKEGMDKKVRMKIGDKVITFVKQDYAGDVYIYGEDEYGEPYIDVSTNLRHSPLIDAVWVLRGGDADRIAMKLPFLRKTNLTTRSGYNTYVKYDVF